jgi:hypothetical protein
VGAWFKVIELRGQVSAREAYEYKKNESTGSSPAAEDVELRLLLTPLDEALFVTT